VGLIEDEKALSVEDRMDYDRNSSRGWTSIWSGNLLGQLGDK